MRVTVTLALEIPDHEVSVKSIDDCVFEAMPRFASEAWQKFVWEVEERALSQHRKGDLQVKSHEERKLWTSSGMVNFTRRRFTCGIEDKSLLLFDMRTGLGPWQRRTESANRIMAEAAAEIPSYRISARSLGRTWKRTPSPMLLWRAVKEVGTREQQRKKELRQAVFQDGDLPDWQKPAPEFLAVEADGTYISAWRQKGKDHEVQVGISYTGKNRCRKRRSLAQKSFCAGISNYRDFGRDLFAMTQQKHNVIDVKNGLFLSDGAIALRNIQKNHFNMLTPQLDWAHMTRRVHEAYGPQERDRSADILNSLYAGRRGTACRQVTLDYRRKRKRREPLKELLSYIQGPGTELYGTRKLRVSGAKVPPHMNGSGGIERNIGILVTHRMKRKGMSWTKNGARNLLAVRTSMLNKPITAKPRVS